MTDLNKNRIESIDLLKGVVMVIMALDHTRDYFYNSVGILDITNPAQANLTLYFTRWVTHFCAPTFSFLAGISAFMSGRRKSKTELSVFLLKRGLWLVFLELTIITFAWYFDVQFRNVDMAVIWCLGISMIFLAGFIHLPKNVILIISFVLIFGHNLLDTVHFDGQVWWSILHEFTTVRLSETHNLNIVYPIIPWVGVMALGYYFGNFYNASFGADRRKKLLNTIGITALLVFVLLRWSNLYGDPLPWKAYETAGQNLMSFLNVNKYPPSLLYLLVTMSVALLFLANSEKWRGKAVDFFSVFGRVPFFYYIMHLYLIRVISFALAELTGHGWEMMVQTSFDINLKGFGFNLGVVYLLWIGIVWLLYPLCRWFDAYKQKHKEKWWLGYL